MRERIATVLALIAAIASAASAIFSGQQVVTANRQLAVAEDAEKRQLRAYLHISHGAITVSENTAAADLLIAHSGQTPAYKIKLNADIQVGHFPLPGSEILSLPTHGLQTFEFGALYGNEPIRQRISMPLNSNDAIEIQRRSRDRLSGGPQVFYLHGIVRYQDIFGNEWPYEFCFSFDPVDRANGSETGCEKYNKPG